MIGALIIVFREVIEAGLIVGIVLAATRGVPGRLAYIWGGIGAGALGACVVAAFAGAISGALSGMGQEAFNAGVLAIAVVMLAWHNIWMARHGREMAAELKLVGAEVAEGARSLMALAVVVGVAVLREGAEIALFLYGVVVADGGAGWPMVAGGLMGLALGAGLSLLTFKGLVAIPMKHLFRVTSLLITFMAAGMAAQSVGYLQQAGLVTSLDQPLWDSSWLLSDTSVAGRILHVLFGYADQPSGMQLLAYAIVVAIIFLAMRLLAPHSAAPAARPAE
jgi:high-affinity iron transporter